MENKSGHKEKSNIEKKFQSASSLENNGCLGSRKNQGLTDAEDFDSEINDLSDEEDDNHEDNIDGEDLSDDDYYHDPGSDDEQNCPICLNDFEKQQIGVPSNCQHIFCVDCLLEWSKKANSCPVDRIKFQSVLVFHQIGGLFNREVSIQASAFKSDDEEDETLCQICGRGHDEETLLLCDGCDLAYHCACLSPPLDAVPAGEWFCERCKEERGEVASSAQPRLIGRTNLSERVRSRVTRTRQRHIENYPNFDEQLDAIIDEILQTASQRFQETESSITKRQKLKKKPLKRRRSRRRRGRSKKRSKSRSRKSRDVNTQSSSITKADFQDQHRLSVTGRANELNDFDGNSNENEVPSHVIAKRHRLLTQSAIKYNTPLPSLFSLHEEATSYPPLSPPPPMPDLLSSILCGQDLLFTPSSQVTIQRNGNLEVKNQQKLESSCSNKQTSFEKPSADVAKELLGDSKLEKKNSSEEKSSDNIDKEAKSSAASLIDELKKSEPNSTQTGSMTRTSVSSTSSKASIMIKPIFSLPKPKKVSASGEENEEGWQEEEAAPRKEDVYDPFRPTETDDELEDMIEKISDEPLARDSSAPEPSSPSDDETDTTSVENEEIEVMPVPVTKVEPSAASDAPAADDDFEIDIFAEEELEKAQAEAYRKAAEALIPDPLKMWRNEVRQTSVTEDPHITLPTPHLKDSSPIPMKFKKRNRKEKTSVYEAEGSFKSHYRSNKSSKQDENLSKAKKTTSKRKKSSDDEIAHEAESSLRRNRKHSDKRSNRSDQPREALKSFKKRRSSSPEHVPHRTSTNNLVYRVRNSSDDAKLKKEGFPDEDWDRSRKRKSSKTDHDRSRKQGRVDENRKRATKMRLSPEPRRTPPTYHHIDDDLLWSLNPPTAKRTSEAISSKTKARKKHDQMYYKHERESSVERGKQDRKKRKTYSSESEPETVRKKKRKKKYSPKRRSSVSSLEEKKVKKKKKKSSRSPKKETVKRKIIINRNQKNDSVSTKPSVSSNLSFEHIFADFDDIKKTKKKKSKKKDEKKKAKKSTVLSEEEIPVIYEYESLSEGEILSSSDEAKRMKKPSVIVVNANGGMPVNITPLQMPSNVVGEPFYTFLTGASVATPALKPAEVSKSSSFVQNEVTLKSDPDPPIQIVPIPEKSSSSDPSARQMQELDLFEGDDNYVVEEQEMILETSSLPALSGESELVEDAAKPSQHVMALKSENEDAASSDGAEPERTLVETKKPVEPPTVVAFPEDFSLQKQSQEIAPAAVPSTKAETTTIQAEPCLVMPDDVSSPPLAASAKNLVRDEKDVTSVEEKAFDASQEKSPMNPNSTGPDILPLLDYLKALKRGSVQDDTEAPPPDTSATASLINNISESTVPLQTDPPESLDVKKISDCPRSHNQPEMNHNRFSPLRVKTTTSDQVPAQKDQDLLKSTCITVNNNYSKSQIDKKSRARPDKLSDHEFDPLMISMGDSYNIRTSDKSPFTVKTKNPDLYSPSCPISPSSSDGLKPNSVVKKHKIASSSLMSVDEKVTRYLQNTAVTDPREIPTSDSTSDSSRLKPSSRSARESRASKGSSQAKKSSVVQKSQDFQQKVVEVAKAAIMPYFKRREVSKEQYKEIMKKAVNKMCKDAKGKNVDPGKVEKLIKKYVGNCLEINEKNKEKMRLVLNRRVDKHMKKKSELDFSTSPPSPTEDSPTAIISSTKKKKLPRLSPPPYPPAMKKKR